MSNYNESIKVLLKAIAELRRQNLEPRKHLERWVNLCAALTTDLEEYFCERDRQVLKECTTERRKTLKAG